MMYLIPTPPAWNVGNRPISSLRSLLQSLVCWWRGHEEGVTVIEHIDYGTGTVYFGPWTCPRCGR